MRNNFDVDEARRLSGFDSLDGHAISSETIRAIKRSADKEKQTSTTLEFQKFKIQKHAVKEARETLENLGFKVVVSDIKGIIRLNISWFLKADKERVLVL